MTTELAATSYLDHIALDVQLIEEQLAAATPDTWTAPVPACPGWTVRQLVGHLGAVHRMVAHAIETGTPARSGQFLPGDEVELPAWFSYGAKQLLGILADNPARPAWSFDPQGQTLGFWQRRQAMENVVHRVDVQAALGAVSEVAADLAADGVSEVVDVMLRLRAADRGLALPDDGSVDLRADDTGHAWRLGTGPAVGSATGRAEQVFLVLWKRVPASELILGGDPSAVRAILDLPLTP